MTDKIRDYEQAVINAAMRLLEASVEGHDETMKIRDVKRAAFYLGRESHARDLYRRTMPKKRAATRAGKGGRGGG